ncbi:DUF1294 domain-containing protein [Desulfosporosinus sp. PR]|uniref:DUF1294 domain-containing protein n=1 Tax=Candidatus Desulfosporosinus nitrosoreducens TaxID=3401928 RepID=UPI0027F34637|nr:DUF1294 domain-containing protein [Desulfosporosinus sp. PR]MDQ7096960.1 DUF1294 domain-containing protein [Desulfosporosinus sp. PR]
MILKTFLVVYILWNCYVFIAMGRDKRRAKLHRWRISETSLLGMGVVLGGVGLYAGMKCFHHKTAHKKFVFGVPLLMAFNVVVLGFLLYQGHHRLGLF